VNRPRGRPKADETKVFTAIRLDSDVLETFKATGKVWQTRVNAALRQFIAEHPLGRQLAASTSTPHRKRSAVSCWIPYG
jgi:hypothetical protein